MTEPRKSAALILHRQGASGALEVFLVERAVHLRHYAGQVAFPGGAVEPGDETVPLRNASGDADPALLGCAARELFEETGVLADVIAGDAAGARDPSLAASRGALLSGEAEPRTFASLLADRGLAVDPGRFVPAIRLVTPRFTKSRFDTTFFLVAVRGEPSILPGELVRGLWRSPLAALEAWGRGELRLSPPVAVILEALAAAPLDEAIARLRAVPAQFEGSGRAIPVAPGYDFIPLETPPLPPEIPTNAILAGGRRFILVDSVPRRAPEQEHLFAAIDRRLAAGGELGAVVLTHHHPDHVGCLEEAAARYRAPVWAHARCGELLRRPLDRALEEGDEIVVDGSRGREAIRLRVLFTPGHAEDHIALHDEEARLLIAGDLVSTLVSMYVGSPGGSLRQYFATLERIRALGLETLLPSHGAPSHDPAKLIDETLRHRRARIEEVHAALREAAVTPLALALEIYPESAQGKLRPLIERTTRAALEYLVEEGRAESVGEDQFRRG
jgi:glyoxylase-like metal-dependent hydrolase (beta-lactamase superfamily II)/8-oxo-dGTP pyrophosphatase MutT (NUDIX family)